MQFLRTSLVPKPLTQRVVKMKRPQPDVKDVMLNRFQSVFKSNKKLLRAWGTETINGVEVMKGRQFYYPTPKEGDSSFKRFKELFTLLGAYKDVTSANYKGIRQAWLYFNKEKGRAEVPSAEEFIASNLNKVWWDEPTVGKPMPDGVFIDATAKISYQYSVGGYRKVPCDFFVAQNEYQRIDTVNRAFEAIWRQFRVVSDGNAYAVDGKQRYEISIDDPWVQLLTLYSLRGFNSDHEVTACKRGSETMPSSIFGPNKVALDTYLIDVKLFYREFTADDPLVLQIAADMNEYKDAFEGVSEANERNTIRLVQTYMAGRYKEDGTGTINRNYQGWAAAMEDETDAYDSLWYEYKEGYYSEPVYYLRKEIFDDPKKFGLTRKELAGYVLKLVDSDYRKKKRKWYQRFFAVFLFVFSVVMALPSGGLTLVGAALAVSAGVMALTLASVLFSVAGADDWASAFSELNKAIEPLAQIAGIVTFVSSIQSAVRAGLKTVAGNVAADGFIKGLGATVVDGLKGLADTFVTEIIQGGKEFLSGKINSVSIGFTQRMVDLYTIPQKLKLESLQARNRDLQAEYEDMAKEASQERDVVRSYMYVYNKPATADWSIYAEEFDVPYERGGGNLHIGNIQKTTKQAMRKADYSDPAFDNITLL